ncbi:hypothetical protein AOQ73_18190 [Bradyrhizobium pachyrhizi]|uniref:hypothetical protein n=1 Tax=Bradyrhizobium pachyrhizi TaxID=280333 RepID=UPI000713C916|nr:hypothetical protein [Bradyrhizobium pachyrhizi]KRQ01285.1 hypothetical protein AOQ73_18190 [Bradyrhizobium pachyrhizi]
MHVQFSELVTFCGSRCEVQSSLTNMKPHIAYFSEQAVEVIKGRGGANTSTLSPYIGRGLLEVSLTALLFRIDPFRGLTLMRFQTHNDFDHNRPNQISIDWNGDLLADVAERDDIWKPKQKPEQVSRALLSPYTDEVIWQPAFVAARDYMDGHALRTAHPSVMARDPDAIINGIRGEARQLYSFWSKGIHGEFFAIGSNTLDVVTCADRMKRTIDLIVELAFLTHFACVSVGNLEPEKACESYLAAKEGIHG